MRMIPGKTKVKIELFRGLTIADTVIGVVLLGVIVLVISTGMPGCWWFALGLVLLGLLLLVRINAEPNYVFFLRILRHLGYRHHYAKMYSDELILASYDKDAFQKLAVDVLYDDGKHAGRKERRAAKRKRSAAHKKEEKLLKDPGVSPEEKDAILRRRSEEKREDFRQKAQQREEELERDWMTVITPFTAIENDMISYDGEYYGAAIEITPVEFRFFSEYRRTAAIEGGLGRVLRNLSGDYAANIVKLDRPVNYNAYREREYEKLRELRASFEQGLMTEQEFQARVEVLFDRLQELTEYCTKRKVVTPYYYLVLFESSPQQLNLQVQSALSILEGSDLPVHRLNNRELALFLKYTNQIDVREDEVDRMAHQDYVMWAQPDTVDIGVRTVEVNHIITYNFMVSHYPTMVGDSWLASVMSMPNTKVVVKCRPMDRGKAVRNIDRSLQELRGQYTSTTMDSRRVSLAEHIETLNRLLNMLQNSSETLLETNIYVTAYDITATRADPKRIQPPDSLRRNITNLRQTVRRYYREAELNLSTMDFDQMNAFVGGQISGYDPMAKEGQGIPSNSLAACYPWIFANVSDVGGIKMGSFEGVPVYVDFFRRDRERVNSNMVIVGKTGSGKSYAAKALLANLSAEDAKIFVLDPENEYTELAENLHGKFINVGNAQQGRLNPFHIITALEDDEADTTGVSGSYATHLQFLEEFFRQILPDCSRDALEYLNSLIDRMYATFGITPQTDLSTLQPEDYPVFDNLYEMILSSYQTAGNDYVRDMLRTLITYVGKFSADGRNANIWNGPSTVTTSESFTVFNFQSLLANRNNMVANAQMLLVLKYIDNEIIKNRNYNEKYGLHRKIVVVIDEAHVFIDSKYPVALDFMYQLAKRIRKYNGMQIVITQNIKDFVGSEELTRKSAAIINACQYSLIFSLAPNDMQDLCKLYEKAGGINEIEQDKISSAPRGKAFAVLSPKSRSSVEVEVPQGTAQMFLTHQCPSQYYAGRDGAAAWDKFVGESREKNRRSTEEKRAGERTYRLQPSENVLLTIISEEELAAEVKRLLAARHGETEEAATQTDSEDTTMKVSQIKRTSKQNVKEGASVQSKQPIKRKVKPSVAKVAPQSDSRRTEEMLAQLLGKFSYDSLAAEIRRSVREELAAAAITPAAPAAPAAPIAPVVPMAAAAPVVPEAAAAVEEDDFALMIEEEPPIEIPMTEQIFDSDDFDSTLRQESGEEAAQPQPESVAFASIFNEEAMAEAARLNAEEAANNTDSSSDDEMDFDLNFGGGDDDFDIMALLDNEVKKMENSSPIDMMDVFGEKTVKVTLAELEKFNNKQS